MTKTELILFEYEHCGECPHPDSTWANSKSKAYCSKLNPRRLLNRDDLWGKIPDFCPLEEKK